MERNYSSVDPDKRFQLALENVGSLKHIFVSSCLNIYNLDIMIWCCHNTDYIIDNNI